MTISLGCSFLVGRLEILPAAIASVRPFVDRLFALVDSRCPAEVWDYLRSERIDHDAYQWADDFAGAINAAHDRLGTDWGYSLDTDEMIVPESGSLLRALAERGEREGIDGFAAPRRHWLDLDMTRQFTAAGYWPDSTVRLRRAGFRYVGRVHQGPAPGLKVVSVDGPVVEHFALALNTPEALRAKGEDYWRLAHM